MENAIATDRLKLGHVKCHCFDDLVANACTFWDGRLCARRHALSIKIFIQNMLGAAPLLEQPKRVEMHECGDAKHRQMHTMNRCLYVPLDGFVWNQPMEGYMHASQRRFHVTLPRRRPVAKVTEGVSTQRVRKK
jgi:hypothetical protein